jgi:hypothetical protein
MVGGPQTPIDTQTQHTTRALPRRYNHVWLFPFTWLPTSRREGGRHTAGGNLGPGQGSNPGVMHIFYVHSLGVFYSVGTATDVTSGHLRPRAKAWALSWRVRANAGSTDIAADARLWHLYIRALGGLVDWC